MMAEKKSTYVNQEGDIRERLRLKRQEEVLNRAMDVLQQVDLSGVRDILDIACGTGRWCIEIKKAYPEKTIRGIDNDRGILEFAKAQAGAEDVEIDFQQMSALEPLAFPDASFDLVNARLLFGFMPAHAWPALLAECWRILRPGGTCIFTETEGTLSNNYALDQLWQYIYIALHRVGYTFADDPRMNHVCVGLVIPSLFQQAGFVQICHRSFDVDFSTGTEAHEPMLYNFVSAFENGAPFITKTGAATVEEIQQAQRYIQSCLHKPNFLAMWHFISTTGQKS